MPLKCNLELRKPKVLTAIPSSICFPSRAHLDKLENSRFHLWSFLSSSKWTDLGMARTCTKMTEFMRRCESTAVSRGGPPPLPLQGCDLISTIKDGVSFLVIENSCRCNGIRAFFCIWRKAAWFTYLEATAKLQSQQNSAGQLQCHTWMFMFAVEASLHSWQTFNLSSALRNRNPPPTEVTASSSPTEELAAFIPLAKTTRRWFCSSLRTHKALSSLGYGWHSREQVQYQNVSGYSTCCSLYDTRELT